MNVDPIDQLLDGCNALALHLNGEQVLEFRTYLNMLVSANADTNLTAVRDGEAIVKRHFVESLALGSFLWQGGLLGDGQRVLDLGSGAGLPGLPLKIVWPRITLALLEATGKKARFLERVVDALRLTNVSVLAGRAEELAHEAGLRETFGLIVARSVAAMPVLVELALPFLRLGGVLAALKGSRAAEELSASAEALTLCGGEVIGHHWIEDSSLGLVLVQKTGATPKPLPRRAGVPARRPIGS
jgi:16S rRNA (guanine527-N7)-methyltransferase